MTKQQTLSGTWTLLRFMLRRDRIQIPVWFFSITLTILATLISFEELYPSEIDRQAIAGTMATPASIALTGPKLYLEDYHFGSMMSHQMLSMVGIAVALMSIFLIVRHTRKEEETGRSELVRASVVGRHANATAVLIFAIGANLLLGLIVAVGLGVTGVESITWEGSFLFGTAMASIGISFSGLTIVIVQLMEHSRAASGLSSGILAIAFSLRAVGDLGNEALSWISPIGWAQQTEAYLGNDWTPLLLSLFFTIVLIAIAYPLSNMRDVGAGLVRPRPGREDAPKSLSSALGLAFRLQRTNLFIWSFALLLFGMSYGAFIGEAEEMFGALGDSLEGMLPEMSSGVLADSVAAMFMTVSAMFASIPALQSILRLRSEEKAGRLDSLLSTPVARKRLLASYLVIALGSSVVFLFMAGIGMGITGSQSMGDIRYLSALTFAGLAFLPALWVAIGFAVFLYGLFPRKAGFSWAIVVHAFLVLYLGGALQLPEWLTDLSPFGHIPSMPAQEFELVPLLVLSGVALVLIVIGFIGYRRRDITN